MLSQDQIARTIILTTQDPTPQELYAATELRHYLGLMTGALFTIAAETPDATSVIAIGEAAKPYGLAYDKATHGPDGFTVRTIGHDIAIVGGVRGVIYGVYELLEHLGCRFFTHLCEKVPIVVDLPVP
ncbi:MAG: hypothetical protein FWG38_08155, partial [Defluviitaleaceae bacterium]|nr:hypothetical protein [Defluviitaleaceae bacterium]